MQKKPLAPIALDRKKSVSLQTQLALGLKEQMHRGALPPEDRARVKRRDSGGFIGKEEGGEIADRRGDPRESGIA